MLEDSDETRSLLEKVSQGQGSAFERLFAMHRDYLKRVVRVHLHPNSRFDESDVVQETHLFAHKRFEKYLADRPMPFKLWLRKTAQQRLANMLRDNRAMKRNVDRQQVVNQSSVMIAQQLAGTVPSPSEMVSKQQTIQMIGQALDELETADREMLILRHFEGMSHREIAQVLDIEESASRKRYGRVLLRFQKLLVRDGSTRSEFL